VSTAGRFVGQKVLRREDPRLLTGHGRFVDDVMLPGMLHCTFVRSDVARGRIAWLSPIARALTGRRVGDEVVVHTPRGEEELVVLAIEPLRT
jgi:carbon-monoxide dehydrogenase large subunit